MRVLVATRQGQGNLQDDFFHCIEGELVRMPDFACADPNCGCDRSVAGMASSKASTTFMSVDRSDLDRDAYRRLFLDALERDGWIERGERSSDLDAWIQWHIELAEEAPPGVVLRARLERGGRGRR